MEDLTKVNSLQLYRFWKNLSIGLLSLIAMLAISRILPFYASPIVAFLCSAFLYTLIYNNRISSDGNCVIVLYSLLYCVINYTIATVMLSVLEIWNIVSLPDEFLFLNDPYIPSLLLCPICFLTLIVLYIRRNSLSFCQSCKLKTGGLYERGRNGQIFRYESFYQIKNLIYLFGSLSVLIWSYYQFVFIKLALNSRDWYVFTWLSIIAFIIDEIYFIYRYYNLYLDLKENDEIITEEELQDMTAKTYLRYYVICDNKIFLDPHTITPQQTYKEVLDTPFITKRAVNGIPLPEVLSIIQRLTGVKDGELRFFYGRKSPDLKNHSLLRYFYFLDGKPEDYPELPLDGEWVDFDDVKRMYTHTPGKFAPRAISDLSRLATIILTEKIFTEDGKRKSKIKSYSPTFNLRDVRASQLDFQDDKWVRISMFNSDTPFYKIKKLFKTKPRVR
ncbi:MAG: hypothetical protein HDR48_04570 [Bacteroides sp.]|nr:hypothetical protein [Bacteroides sp.]MBD5419290.1 hypothetical protein [Bacteroides sp.]